MKKIPLTIALLAAALFIAACGGGGGSRPAQQRTATITFAIFANSTTHINAVTLSARLPAGTEVALDPGTVNLREPDLNSAQGFVQGTYSSGSRKVNLSFAGESSTAGSRPFATLTCTVLPGFNFTQENFTTLNTPFPTFLAVGFDPSTTSTITTNDVLRGKVVPTMTVSFGF